CHLYSEPLAAGRSRDRVVCCVARGSWRSSKASAAALVAVTHLVFDRTGRRHLFWCSSGSQRSTDQRAGIGHPRRIYLISGWDRSTVVPPGDYSAILADYRTRKQKLQSVVDVVGRPTWRPVCDRRGVFVTADRFGRYRDCYPNRHYRRIIGRRSLRALISTKKTSPTTTSDWTGSHGRRGNHHECPGIICLDL